MQVRVQAEAHLLEDVVQLLQRGSDRAMAADAAHIAVVLDPRRAVQGVVAEGADHRGPDLPDLAAGERRLVRWGVVPHRLVRWVLVLAPARSERLHRAAVSAFLPLCPGPG